MLSNLIRNALKHGEPPVEISCTRAEISIRDHGPGFDDRFLSLGPQRFARTIRERGGGHGLGLTIALGQTAVLGGKLTFGNAPGGGATVSLRLAEAGTSTTAESGPRN